MLRLLAIAGNTEVLLMNYHVLKNVAQGEAMIFYCSVSEAFLTDAGTSSMSYKYSLIK